MTTGQMMNVPKTGGNRKPGFSPAMPRWTVWACGIGASLLLLFYGRRLHWYEAPDGSQWCAGAHVDVPPPEPKCQFYNVLARMRMEAVSRLETNSYVLLSMGDARRFAPALVNSNLDERTHKYLVRSVRDSPANPFALRRGWNYVIYDQKELFVVCVFSIRGDKSPRMTKWPVVVLVPASNEVCGASIYATGI